jgi:hypothetical protein
VLRQHSLLLAFRRRGVGGNQRSGRKASGLPSPPAKGPVPAGAPPSIPGPAKILVQLVQLLARSAAKDELHTEPSNDSGGTLEALDDLPAPDAGHSNRAERDS